MTSTLNPPARYAPAPPVPQTTSTAPRIEVVGLNQHTRGHQTLHNVSFAVRPGEIVAIAGGSGSGKTTLLETMAGLRRASSGWVLVDGEEFTADSSRAEFGYVPQDDIIHTELPLRRTLEHSAALRLAPGTPSDVAAAVVQRTLERLDLDQRADVTVASLSGGQRKRASIGVELLTDPHLFYLDEPTSGLDPASSAELMDQLRELADAGTTVVLTTHAPNDLCRCDRVIFLGRDGYLAFIGTPDEAIEHFDVDTIDGVYQTIGAAQDPAELPARFLASEWSSELHPSMGWPRRSPETSVQRRSAWSQWRALTRRNVDLLRSNTLTLAILLGSPAMVVGMMAVLFRPGTFAADQPSVVPAIQSLFWVAFAAFFFGVTYGLLQIVGEHSIFKRERFAGLGVGGYVASKLALLAPLLTVVNIAMLAVLRGLDRLPANSIGNWLALTVTLVLISVAALTMGLLASAAVSNPAQATLALPMLCFPQVLFAGAVVPTSEMAALGRWFSTVLADRWGFEALGRTFGLDEAAAANPATAGYSEAFSGSPVTAWVVLVSIAAVSLTATVATLHRKS